MEREGKMIAPLASESSVKYCYELLTQNTDVCHFFHLLALYIGLNITEINRVIHWIMIYSYQRCPPCEQIGPEVIKVYWNFYETLSRTSCAQINSQS